MIECICHNKENFDLGSVLNVWIDFYWTNRNNIGSGFDDEVVLARWEHVANGNWVGKTKR